MKENILIRDYNDNSSFIGKLLTNELEKGDVLLLQPELGGPIRFGVIESIDGNEIKTDTKNLKIRNLVDPNSISVRNIYTTGVGDIMVMGEKNSDGLYECIVKGVTIYVEPNQMFEL